MLDVCKYAIFFKKLYYSNKILFLDWIFLWFKISSLKALGVEGKSGASQEEASKRVSRGQPSWASLPPGITEEPRVHGCVAALHPGGGPLHRECKQPHLLYGRSSFVSFQLHIVSFMWVESLFQSFGKKNFISTRWRYNSNILNTEPQELGLTGKRTHKALRSVLNCGIITSLQFGKISLD